MNQLKTKIDEVKEKLGLTQMQLSERIGKNPYYLDTVKHRGVTTERQNELMLELELVAKGGNVMTERAVIAELTEKAESLQEKLNKAQSANKELCNKLENLDFARMVLEVEKEDLEIMHNQESRLMQEYKRQYRDLVATVIVIGIIVVLGLAIWGVM